MSKHHKDTCLKVIGLYMSSKIINYRVYTQRWRTPLGGPTYPVKKSNKHALLITIVELKGGLIFKPVFVDVSL
jgi:hypothetical protein